jgi:hypothetical protein
VAPVTNETLLRYCTELYQALERNATKRDGHEKMWEGKFTELFASVGISNTHYAKVVTTLQEIGCIEYVRKGARGVPSLIALHSEPTADALGNAHGLQSRLTNPTPHDKLSQRVTVLEGRLQDIDLVKLFANQEQRLRKLEAKLLKKER